MILAALTLAGKSWWLLALVLAVGLGALAWFAVKPAEPGRGALAVGLGLRGLGIGLLVFALLDPRWTSERAKKGANVVAVLVDNSRSLDITETNATRTRGEEMKAAVTNPTNSWWENLAAEFQVRTYTFDESVARVNDYTGLDHDGGRSDLIGALRQMASRLDREPLAGVIVLTDGVATDWPADNATWADLPPIYPVVVGRANAVRDLRITHLDLQQTAFDDAPVSLRATVAGRQMADRTAELSIQSLNTPASNLPAPRSLLLNQSVDDPAETRFEWRPGGHGVQFYQLTANLPEDEGEIEATTLNNRRYVMVNRGRQAYRLLYVGGRPNWEFKFLNRALQQDPQLDLVALIRLARREPKFEFRGRGGESNNPLYRGFDRETDAAPRYDEPVLTRLNTRDEEELRAGFPGTAEELFTYDAVILDDVEAEFFSPHQQQLLRRFVSERGGGLLMLGGVDTLENGDYRDSPLAAALPVYLDRNVGSGVRGDLRWDLTREGWVEPWTRVRANAVDERDRLMAMPRFQVANALDSAKPGATILAQLEDNEGRTYPALAAQRFGNGRSAALMVGDMWRWGLADAANQDDLARFWRQLGRWLVTDVPGRVTVAINPGDSEGEVNLRMRVFDEEYQPLDLARVQVSVARVAGLTASEEGQTPVFTTVSYTADPDPDRPGHYTAKFAAREPGGYHVTIEASDRVGKLVGTAESGWVHDPLAEEMAQLEPGEAQLARLADATGGALLRLDSPDDLPTLAGRLVKAPAPITESRSEPLWHNPWVFLAVLGCFLAEWAWRRWKGLP